jgi:hypothetical protein
MWTHGGQARARNRTGRRSVPRWTRRWPRFAGDTAGSPVGGLGAGNACRVPERETFELFRQWKDVFDRYPMRHSAAYHSFRSLFGWDVVPGRLLRTGYEIDDLKEGRTDPCGGWI